MAICFDAGHGVLLALAGGAVAALAWQRREGRRHGVELSVMRAELDKIQAQPMSLEYRLERFDVLWYVTVTASRAERRVLSVSAGLPQCRKCVEPLSAGAKSGEWNCRACGQVYPESLVDTVVLDTVTRQALDQFAERHKDYRLPPKS